MPGSDRPCSNILRGVTVSIIFVAAFLATETQTFPIGCRDMAAGATTPACVFGINCLQFNSNSSSFIPDLKPGISVRPTVDFGSEVFPFAQRTVSDIRQVFNHDPSRADFNRVVDQCFRSDMQEMSRYGSLIPGEPLQESSGTSGANGLDSSASAPDASAAVIKHPAVEEKCFGVGRVGRDQHAFDAHVHPDNATLGFKCGNFNLMGKQQIPLVTNTLDLGIFPANFRYVRMLQSDGLAKNGDAFSVAEQVASVSQRHGWPLIDAQIPFAQGLQSFITGSHLAKQGAGQLRRQSELLADGRVKSAVQTIRVQFFGLKHLLGNPAGRRQVADGNRIHVRRVGQLYLDCADCFQYNSTIA